MSEPAPSPWESWSPRAAIGHHAIDRQLNRYMKNKPRIRES